MGRMWNEARQDRDRQLEKLRIARHIVELLREAEVFCELAYQDDQDFTPDHAAVRREPAVTKSPRRIPASRRRRA